MAVVPLKNKITINKLGLKRSNPSFLVLRIPNLDIRVGIIIVNITLISAIQWHGNFIYICVNCTKLIDALNIEIYS